MILPDKQVQGMLDETNDCTYIHTLMHSTYGKYIYIYCVYIVIYRYIFILASMQSDE